MDSAVLQKEVDQGRRDLDTKKREQMIAQKEVSELEHAMGRIENVDLEFVASEIAKKERDLQDMQTRVAQEIQELEQKKDTLERTVREARIELQRKQLDADQKQQELTDAEKKLKDLEGKLREEHMKI